MNRLLIAILAAATLGTAAWAVLRPHAIATKPCEVKACCQRPPSRAALLQGK